MSEQLNDLRLKINKLDADILSLLQARAEVAQEIGQVKRTVGLEVFDPAREAQVLQRLQASAQGPLPGEAVVHIFREIISACRGLQKDVRVAFLGPEATFSHLAAIKRFGESATFVPCDTIEDVFRLVEASGAEFGIVPVENSTYGTIGTTFDCFTTSPLEISGEICEKISQALLTKASDEDKIEKIYSHPQALAQCRGWISKHLPKAICMAVESTAAAAKIAAEDETIAAIGNEMLANKYGLNILACDIQDRADNQTKFWVIGTEECGPTGDDKTSLRFVAPHTPGSLCTCLKIFADEGVNMMRIESRPAAATAWEYTFFLDVEGHRHDEAFERALKKLSAIVTHIRIMGSYPKIHKNVKTAVEAN